MGLNTIGKFVNLNHKLNKYVSKNKIDYTLLNYISPDSSVKTFSLDILQDLAPDNLENFVEDTEIGNLFIKGITKVITADSFLESSQYYSGFYFNVFPTGSVNGQTSYNTVVIALNKLDKFGMDDISSTRFIVEWKTKATNSTYKKIVFDYTVSSDYNLSPDILYTKKCMFEEGLILIDRDLLKHIGVTSFDSDLYDIAIYVESDHDINLSIAHLAVTNSYDVYFTEKLDFGRDDLSKFTFSEKAGVVFSEINEYSKTYSSGLEMLTIEDLDIIDTNFLKNNIGQPFFVFPYCEGTKDLSLVNSLDSYIYSYRNLESGGLYLLQDITISHSWDTYSLPIKLKEWK